MTPSSTSVQDFIALAHQLRDDLNRHLRPFQIGHEAARLSGGAFDARGLLRQHFPDDPAEVIEAAVPAYEEHAARVRARSREPGAWIGWGARAARALAFRPEVAQADLVHCLGGELDLYPDAEHERVLAYADQGLRQELERLAPLLAATAPPAAPGRLGRALARLFAAREARFLGLVDIGADNPAAEEQAQQLGRRAARFFKLHPDHDYRRWIDGGGLLHVEVVSPEWEDEA